MRRYPWGLMNLVLEDRKEPITSAPPVDPTPADDPRARTLRVFAMSDADGHPFDVVAADFGEAFHQARTALGGRCPLFLGLSASLPGVKQHVLRRRSS